MADVKWIKITTDIFDDEKILLIETMPEADSIIVIWFKLLCLAGKQNNSGVFMMNDQIPYTDKMLATIFRRKESTVQLALQTFEKFHMIELIDGVVTIPKWGKHQNLDQLEARREYMANYMSEYRKKQALIAEGNSKVNGKVNSKANSKVNVNSPDKNKKRIEEEKEEKKYMSGQAGRESSPDCDDEVVDLIDRDFEEAWRLYPRKEGKKKAREYYVAARESGTLHSEIMDGIRRYLEHIRISNLEPRFILGGKTWFYQQRWMDDWPYERELTTKDLGESIDYSGFANFKEE